MKKNFTVQLNDIYFVLETKWSRYPYLMGYERAVKLSDELRKLYQGTIKIEEK